MKYFTLIIFLFLTIISNAQLTMEEIAYIPSPSGYYNNLIVKGNVNINELRTRPLNIQSYGSFLNMVVGTSKGTEISTVTVLADTSIALNNIPTEQTPVWNQPTIVNTTSGNAGLSFQIDNLTPENSELEDYHQVKIAGNFDEAPYLPTEHEPDIYWSGIRNWTINSDKAIYIRGEKLNFEQNYISHSGDSNRNSFISNMTFILGMRVPYCGNATKVGAYKWQEVSVGDGKFTILACQQP